MQNIGINVNSSKDSEGKILNFIEKLVRNEDKDVNIKVFKDSYGLEKVETANLDAIIVLGGDGTILSTARVIAKYEIPLLGINIGNLGFLAEVECIESEKAIKNLFLNNYYIEDRMMVQCSLDNNKDISIALNDIVLSKGTLARIVKYEIYIDGKYYTTFAADGVIVSTPTGSTAYSLSSGGPIIYPTLNLLSITPICPHSIGIRTLVMDGKSKVEIKVRKNYESVFLTVDGQESKELSDADNIIISASPYKCRIIKLNGYDYFDILRKKITYRTKECEGDFNESCETCKDIRHN